MLAEMFVKATYEGAHGSTCCSRRAKRRSSASRRPGAARAACPRAPRYQNNEMAERGRRLLRVPSRYLARQIVDTSLTPPDPG